MTMRKRCELCGGEARLHCESDQASLCWDCDGKVHGANFLAAKHVRVLLCGSCHSPTPWKASGTRLGAAVTVCEGCLLHREGGVEVLCGEERQGDDDLREHDEDEDDEDGEEEDEDLEEEEEEDGENQVVPWACNSPPPGDSLSSTGEILDEFDDVSESRTKRMHEIAHADCKKELECCATSSRTTETTASSNPSSRLAKKQRRADESKQSITRNGQCLGVEEDEPRMESRMVNLMKMLHDDAVSGEDTAGASCRPSPLQSG